MRFAMLLAAGACVLAGSKSAHAWWSNGHSFLSAGSVTQLPGGINGLRSYFDANWVTINQYSSSEPPGRHYIDIDVYSEFVAGAADHFPRDLNVLYQRYGEDYVNTQGTSPWVIANYRTTLTQRMQTARTATEWTALARTAAEMAHYVEDLNQPFHTSRNYDGQYTGNNGIHARYEGELIQRHFADLTITANPANCVYIANTVDWALDSIEMRTYYGVAQVLSADTAAYNAAGRQYSEAYYTGLWNATGAMTRLQFQTATEMVASLWYSAWVDAGSPMPVFAGMPGDYNGDALIDAADYTVWADHFGQSGAGLAGDGNADGRVDAADYTIWADRFGLGVAVAPGSSPIPEPSPASALVAGAALSLRRRR